MSEKKEESKAVPRRSFLKYGAAGVVVVAAAAAGGAYYYSTMPPPTPSPTITATPTQSMTSAVTSTSTPTTTQEPVKIAGLFPLTGPVAFDGQDMNDGAQLAVDEINANGGVLGRPIQLISNDVEYFNVEKLTGVVDRMATLEKVDFFVTTYSSSTGWELDLMAKYEIPYLNANGSLDQMIKVADSPGKFWTSYQTGGPVCYNGVRLPQLIEEFITSGQFTPNNRKIANLTLDQEYSKLLDDAYRGTTGSKADIIGGVPGFAKYGWQEVLHEVAEIGTVEWRPIISKLQKEKPSLIMFTDFVTSDEISFLRQFVANPTDSLLYIAYGPQIPEFVNEGKEVTNGVIHSPDLGQVPDDSGLAWENKFQTKVGRRPGLSASANCYDEVYLWAKACEAAGTIEDHAAVCAQIPKIQYRGICGTYVFDQKTQTVEFRTEQYPKCIPFEYYQIQNLNQICIDPPAVAKPFILPPWMKK